MRHFLLFFVFVLGFSQIHNPVWAQKYHSNRQEKRRDLESNGWKVAYGREVTETDTSKGIAATIASVYTGRPEILTAWATNLIEESLEQMRDSVNSKFSGQAEKEARKFVSKKLKKFLKGPSEDSETKDFGEFTVKVGVAKYSGYYKIWVPNFSREGGYSKKVNATFSYQPYVAIKFGSENEQITSPGWKDIDAAVFLQDSRVYFFRGDEYIRYNFDNGSADPGYPRKISSAWNGMPFTSGIDAAFATPDSTKIYFFNGKQYVRYDVEKRKADPGYPRLISDKWRGVSYDQIDAAFCRQVGKNAGHVYFFRGDRYTKYDMEERKGMNDRRKLETAWHGLPFDDHLDAVLPTSDGRIYFFEGRQFFRYVDDEGTYKRPEVTKTNTESFSGVFK